MKIAKNSAMVWLLLLFTGCVTGAGFENSGQQSEMGYRLSDYIDLDWDSMALEQKQFDQSFSSKNLTYEVDSRPTSATLTRNGKTTVLNGAEVEVAFGTAKAGDHFKLKTGLFRVVKLPTSQVTIEGSGFETVLISGWDSVKLADTTLANLTISNWRVAVAPPHRLWLENVRVIGEFGCTTPGDAIVPNGTSVVAVLGGFYVRPFKMIGPPTTIENLRLKIQNLDNYIANSLGTVAIMSGVLPAGIDDPEIKAFLRSYFGFLKGGPAPSPELSSRALVAVRKKIGSGVVSPNQSRPANASSQVQELLKSKWQRLASILKRDFGASTGGPEVTPAVVQAVLAEANAAIKGNRPLSAIFYLSKLGSSDLSTDVAVAVKRKIAEARATLGRLYGTAIEYELTSVGSETAKYTMGSNTYDYKNTYVPMRSSLIREPLNSRFPINRIADSNSARYRVKILQTRDDWENKRATSKVEERSYQIEDPAAQAARRAAASQALWSKFESTMSNFDRAASAIEKSAKTDYEQRVRIEDEGNAKVLVTYEGKKNQGALRLDNPPLKYEPVAPGMLKVSESTQTLLYNNIRQVAFKGTVSEAGKVLDGIGPFTQTQSWNMTCTNTKTSKPGGGFRENSDCFGGTGGAKGDDVVKVAIEQIVTPWVLAHYQTRVFNETLKRLQSAGKKGNRSEIAEAILLGRSLGVVTSPEQEKVLSEVFQNTKVFDQILLTAATQ